MSSVKFKNDFFTAEEVYDWSGASGDCAITDFKGVLFHDDWEGIQRGQSFAKMTIYANTATNEIVYSLYKSDPDEQESYPDADMVVTSKLMR